MPHAGRENVSPKPTYFILGLLTLEHVIHLSPLACRESPTLSSPRQRPPTCLDTREATTGCRCLSPTDKLNALRDKLLLLSTTHWLKQSIAPNVTKSCNYANQIANGLSLRHHDGKLEQDVLATSKQQTNHITERSEPTMLNGKLEHSVGNALTTCQLHEASSLHHQQHFLLHAKRIISMTKP